jgi:hypothetical protein
LVLGSETRESFEGRCLRPEGLTTFATLSIGKRRRNEDGFPADCFKQNPPYGAIPYRFFMKRLLILCCLMAMACSEARAGMTVLARETFEGVRTLDAATPGNLGQFVEGAWHCRPVGPRVASAAAPGWSADSQGVHVRTFWDLREEPYTAARDGGMAGAWVRFENFEEAGYFSTEAVANPAIILELRSGGDNAPFQVLGVTNSGRWVSRQNGLWRESAGLVRSNTWYWVQIEWDRTEDTLTATASIQAPGQALEALSENTITLADYETTTVHLLNAPFSPAPGQQYRWRGRLGGATLASTDAPGEGGQLPDLLPPVEERHHWFINPATGNDQNDGLSAATAWRTVTKFNLESANAGLLAPRDGGYESGDIVTIDTSTVTLDLGVEQFSVRTRGLTVRPAAGQLKIRLRAHRDLNAPTTVWTRFSQETHPNLWVTTDGDSPDLADVVLWEDDRWLHHVRSTPANGPSAAALTELNATPGSFHSDGVRLFLHPFGSTNPNSDGKNYSRSRYRTNGASAVRLLAPDLAIHGIDVRKTALARSSDGDSYTAYGIQGEEGFGGVTLLQDCYTDYVGKHGIGFTDSNSNRNVTVIDCQVEQGSPYFNQTPFVDYNGFAAATGNRTTYRRCLNYKVAGLVGSTEGQSSLLVTYYIHNNGEGTQFDQIRFEHCHFGGQVTAGSGLDHLVLEDTTSGGGDLNARRVDVNRCVLTQLPFGNNRADGTLMARNNLHIFSGGVFNGAFNVALCGTVVYEGNTFDLRPYLRSDNAEFCLFRRVGALNFTFRNNAFISPKDKGFGVIEHLQSSDTATFSRNLYETRAPAILLRRFTNGGAPRNLSLAEWQSQGQEAGSLATDALFDEMLLPLPGSPAINAGHDLGRFEDHSGRIFAGRRTIGALEPGLTYPKWRDRTFTPGERLDDAMSGPAADPDGDGSTNLFEFVFGTDPKSRTVSSFTFEPAPQLPGLLRLTGAVPNTAIGADLRAEFSTDLRTWLPVALSAAEFIPAQGSAGPRRGFLSPVEAVGGRLFWRFAAALE